MDTVSLSTRGRHAAATPLRADFELLDQAVQDEYHPTKNPTGAIPLCIAENLLGWEQLRDKLQSLAATRQTPDWVASYTSTLGHPDFRAALAKFLSKRLGGNDLNPETMAISAGATATIEMAGFLLADTGDVAVLPGPAYGGYRPDLTNRAGVEVHHITLPNSDEHPGVYQLRTQDLDAAYERLGDRFKLLILTQPNNPTGQVFTEDQIFAAVSWCEERKIHCIVNEIYAMSLIDQEHPDLVVDYEQRQWFVSCLPQLELRNSDYFHWWYSFSKDFGISGLRVGALYTKNDALIKAWANFGAPSISSNYTQWLLTELLAEEEWIANWMKNDRKITESYVTVVQTLRDLGIDYSPAVGSLFVWFDLSSRLVENTDEAWVALWRHIYDTTGLLLTYPIGMGGDRRGWFRMVYSGVSKDTLEEVMRRLKSYCA